jgi:uncharacterized protein
MRASGFRVLLPLLCLLASPVRAADPELTPLSITVNGQSCSALLLRPAEARALLVLAHGQVMNIHTPFMETISAAFARHGIATLRFNFPYAEAKREQSDPPRVLIASFVAAAREAEKRRGSLPLLIGGKSIGGMMAAQAALDAELRPVQGVVLLGYPLHAPGRPSAVNARFLERVTQPMLFVQGSQDPLAELTLFTALVAKLGEHATLEVVAGANHAFEVPEGGRTQAAVYEEIASAVAEFVATLAPSPGG